MAPSRAPSSVYAVNDDGLCVVVDSEGSCVEFADIETCETFLAVNGVSGEAATFWI